MQACSLIALAGAALAPAAFSVIIGVRMEGTVAATTALALFAVRCGQTSITGG